MRHRDDEPCSEIDALSQRKAPRVECATTAPSVSPSVSELPASTTSQPRNPFSGHPYSPRYAALLKVRESLPVYGQRRAIQETVQQHQVTLLVGETGSGKTTQVPHLLAELDPVSPAMVGCTQPRRIAALSVATRVAEEMDVPLGQQVGYHVRFQTARSPLTKVLYLTDGMLLREAMHDRELRQYNVMVVDEAHERTVDTDIVLGLLKSVCAKRPEFRLVVMSATLDVGKIRSFFPGAAFVHVSGRMFDVSVTYSPQAVPDYVAAAVACVRHIHEEEAPGDVLCFLTGEAEIERAVNACVDLFQTSAPSPESQADSLPPVEDEQPPTSPSSSLTLPSCSPSSPCDHSSETRQRPARAIVLPLYGSLRLEDQQKVFRTYPSSVRKIVFATNIAETSLTIDGIVYVVDCGYQKQSLYQSSARVDYLLPAVISKASAAQRKGRAGRTQVGKCYRLFTEADYASFPDYTHPEILRANITSSVLALLKIGISNPIEFPFIDPPSEESLNEAFYQLLFWGAVDDELRLTALGAQMAELPVEPSLARMLLKAPSHHCAADVAAVAAMLEVGQVFLRPPGRAHDADAAHAAFQHQDGDHVTLFFVFHAFHRNPTPKFCWTHFLRFSALQQAMQIYGQLRTLLARQRIPVTSTYQPDKGTVDTVALRKAILEGYFTQVAYRSANSSDYVTVQDGLPVRLNRGSVLCTRSGKARPRWILYARLEVHGEQGTFARTLSPVEPAWLVQVSDYYATPHEIEDPEIIRELTRAKESQQEP